MSRVLTIITAAAALALAASPASASTLTTTNGSDGAPFQAALASSYMPTPNVSVAVDPTGCPSNPVAGCSMERTIWIGGAWTGIFLHELGHVTDAVLLERGAGHREAFAAFTGQAFDVEQFADVYGTCAQRGLTAWDTANVRTLSYGFELTAERYNAACALVSFITGASGFDAPGMVAAPVVADAPVVAPVKVKRYRCKTRKGGKVQTVKTRSRCRGRVVTIRR